MVHTMRGHSGFSLVELMIAMTIGLLLLSGLAAIFVNSSDANRELQKTAQQIENGRYAIETVSLGKSEVKSLQTMLQALGYYRGAVHGELDEAMQQALEALHDIENLEMRRLNDPTRLDVEVFRFIEEKYRTLRN